MTIRRGTTPTFVFNVVEQGTAEPKNLVGATEVTLAIGVRREARERDLMITLGAGVTHNGTGGVITAILTAEQTEGLPIGHRWAELWITDLQSRRDLIGEGTCIVLDTLITVPEP